MGRRGAGPRRLDASYLPAWSSRAAATATYAVGPEGLRLWIPPEQPRWCPGLHDDPPLRVSAVQSGNWSGPVGSTRGQQPFREGRPAKVGCGIHPFRDPALSEDFEAERRAIDVSEPHTYAVDWRPGGVDFLHDGQLMRSSSASPDYPMMLILAVFDFPGRSPEGFVPELVVRSVIGPAG